MAVHNDIHRLHVFFLREKGKIARSLMAHNMFFWVFVKGCNRPFACSGNGNGTTWNNRGSNGYYWSSSFNSSRNARNLNFNSGGVNPQNNSNRYNGFAVRAVQYTLLVAILTF